MLIARDCLSLVELVRSYCRVIAERFQAIFQRLLSDSAAVAKLRSDYEAIAKPLQRDYSVCEDIAHGSYSDCAAITKRFLGDCAAIVQRLRKSFHSDCEAIARRFLSDSAAVAKLRSDYDAIAKPLRQRL
jgi:hypothetical protein